MTKNSFLVFWLLIISADIISSSWFDTLPVRWYKGVIILQNRHDAIWIDLKTASKFAAKNAEFQLQISPSQHKNEFHNHHHLEIDQILNCEFSDLFLIYFPLLMKDHHSNIWKDEIKSKLNIGGLTLFL